MDPRAEGWGEQRAGAWKLGEALGLIVGPGSSLAAVWPWAGHLPFLDPYPYLLLYSGRAKKNTPSIALISEGNYKAQDKELHKKMKL